MTEQSFENVIQSLREGTFHMNDEEATGVIKIYLDNEIGFRDYIGTVLKENDPIKYLLKMV